MLRMIADSVHWLNLCVHDMALISGLPLNIWGLGLLERGSGLHLFHKKLFRRRVLVGMEQRCCIMKEIKAACLFLILQLLMHSF